MAHRNSSTGRTPSAPHGDKSADGSGSIQAATGAKSVGKASALSGAAAVEPTAPLTAATAVDAAARVKGVTAAQAIAQAAAVSAVTKAAAADSVQSIAERLRRGALTPGQAVEELIDDAVQRNLPGLSADSPLTQELRSLLSAYAKDDPYLASRISKLGIAR